MRESTISRPCIGRPSESVLAQRTLEALQRAMETAPSAATPPGLVLAVSGGADSTALALLCTSTSLRARLGPITIASIDHGQRPESAAEVQAVAALASRVGVAFASARLPLPRGASEQRMRDARYTALDAIVARTGASILATAHHADDQIETVVFRQRRGTGLRGLCGIPERRRMPSGTSLVRPLLHARHHELVALCASYGVTPADDPGNRCLDRARAALRHRALPELRQRAARRGDRDGFDRAVFALASAARAVTDGVERAAAALGPLCLRRDAARGWEIALEHGGQPIHDRVLAELLRQLHTEAALPQPSRHWLARALALRHRPHGSQLAGRGPSLRLTRRPATLHVDRRGAGAAQPGGSAEFDDPMVTKRT